MTDTDELVERLWNRWMPGQYDDSAFTVIYVVDLRALLDTIAALKVENDAIKNQNDHLRHNRALQNDTVEKQVARIEALEADVLAAYELTRMAHAELGVKAARIEALEAEVARYRPQVGSGSVTWKGASRND